MSLAAWVRRWPSTTRCPWLANSLLPRNALQHRSLRLLELEEERIVAVATEQQHDVGARADAADTDHLARSVRVAVALQELAPITRQRPAIGADDDAQEVFGLVCAITQDVFDRSDHGRVADDARLTVDDLRQLRERLQTVLRAGLRQVAVSAFQLFCRGFLPPPGQQLLGIQTRVPELQVAHRRVAPDRLPVRPPHCPVDHLARRVVEATVATRHGKARHQTLDVPLERARQRLVEVVDAEHQSPVGTRKGTEVRKMRIPAQLRVQSRPRHPRQIRRHQQRRPAIERERRHQHPPVADRHQLRHPRLRLHLQQLHRRAPQRRGLPLGVRRARHLGPRRLSPCHSFRDGKMLHPPRLTGRPTYLMRGRTDIRAHRAISLSVLLIAVEGEAASAKHGKLLDRASPSQLDDVALSHPSSEVGTVAAFAGCTFSRVTCDPTLDRISGVCFQAEVESRGHQDGGWVRVARARPSY